MKKLLAVILTLVMVLCLCACEKDDSLTPTGDTNASTTPAETTDPTQTSHTHAYTQSVTKEATCAAEGEKTFTCTCGDSYTEAIAMVAHTYSDATCTAPKTCTVCSVTEGEPVDHDYTSATCTAPKTCKTCGATTGQAAPHNYQGKNCSDCGKQDPKYHEIADGYWASIDTDCGHRFSFDGKGNWDASVYYIVITYEEYVALGSNKDDSNSDDEYGDPFADPQYPYDIIEAGGIKYAYAWPMVGQMEGTYTVKGNVLTIKSDDWFTLVLERTAGNVFTVRSIDYEYDTMGVECITVGEKFIWCPADEY